MQFFAPNLSTYHCEDFAKNPWQFWGNFFVIARKTPVFRGNPGVNIMGRILNYKLNVMWIASLRSQTWLWCKRLHPTTCLLLREKRRFFVAIHKNNILVITRQAKYIYPFTLDFSYLCIFLFPKTS